ncbi:hypothetical protein K2Z83_02055 [Oscillochloris sp. ZM17-4]|uniref:hypothetical protein n=1 Tax=Oscillochloris sp. ZM17-4 TaxID=2866714 RepID=UPI001C73A44D|nr:hypothetical protein [Oscillochloris sp. ZM17-4]MBX0326476.1 hypothetical protein [Oscillochloris sp. ZM17-4]
MAALKSIGRSAHTMKIVKYAITIGAVVITSLGSMAMDDERALAGTHEVASMSVPEQMIDGVRDALAPLATWLAEPDESPASCSQQANVNQ